jgi:hypothetical protein
VHVDAGHAEGRGQQGGCRLGHRSILERLAIQQELGVVLARPPALQHRLDRGDGDRRARLAEHVGDRLQVRREGHDLAHVEVAVGPTIETPADARSERVVHRGVAQRALNAERRHSITVEERRDADHRVGLEQDHGRRRGRQIHFSSSERGDHLAGQRIGVDLEAERQSRLGGEPRADAAVRVASAGDRQMQLQRVAPKRFVAEGLVAKGPPALFDQLERGPRHRVVQQLGSASPYGCRRAGLAFTGDALVLLGGGVALVACRERAERDHYH